MQSAMYKRPSLGQPAYVGALYDARTDTFLPEYIVTHMPEDAIRTTVLNNATTSFSEDSSYKTKFKKLELAPEMVASVLAGFIPIYGSGEYLTEEQSTTPNAHRAMHYSLQTVDESLHLFNTSATQYIDHQQLDRQEATHVLSGIVWGGSLVVSATRELLAGDDKTNAQQGLETSFNTFLADQSNARAARHFAGQLPSGNIGDNQGLEIKLHSDFPDQSTAYINELGDVKHHILDLPAQIGSVNDGKGTQLTYTLLPISFVSMMCNIPSAIVVPQPSLESMLRLSSTLDAFVDVEQRLSQYQGLLAANRFCVPPDHYASVQDNIQQAKQCRADQLAQFSQLLPLIRDGRKGPQEVSSMVESFANGIYAPQSLSRVLEQATAKIEFVNEMLSQGSEYLGYGGGDLRAYMRKHASGTVYVFSFNSAAMHASEPWEDSRSVFSRLLRKGDCSAVVVDCDAIRKHIDGPTVAHYANGELLTEDVNEQEKELATKSCVYHDERYLRASDDVPAQRQAVVIACPAPQCDRTMERNWVCFYCQCPVEYASVDRMLYCGCGKVRFDKVSFRCCGANHGSEHNRFAGADLYRILESMAPPKELNVLILGETGVGKSTFINAFINYLTYNTLDEALKTPQLNWIIPCAFSHQVLDPATNQFNQRKIAVGNDADEHGGAKGKSATQKATAYAIYVQDTLIRLIDTPGMGDVRGPEQDRQNMADVLSVLRTYDNIHGIVILLKPNNARLGFMFRFVIQELLTHLHRSAARNIVYAFTNTRGTDYAPGDSFAPSKQLLFEFKNVLPPLSGDNVYCFDSESFRYLAAQKVENLKLGEKKDYVLSWEKSTKESQRLRRYFQTLQPHPVKNTLSLNATRHLIENLIQPMSQVSKTILGSIADSEKKRRELQNTTATGKELTAKLMMSKTILDAHPSEDPITACVCHDPCSLKEVKPYVPGAQGISGCAAFHSNNGVCKLCNHGWEDHEHIFVWYDERTETTEDPNVRDALVKNKDDTTVITAALAALDRQIAEFKAEHQQIKEAAAKFTVYMQANSITVYNDATLEYLRHLIKEENVKVQLGGKDTRLEALKKECEQYEAYVQTLRDARARGLPGAVPDERGISNLVQDLYAMKHYGKNLQKVANVVSRAYEATFRETAYRVKPKNYWMRVRTSNKSGHGPTRPTGKVYHGSGAPYSTMLDVGPSSSKPRGQPSRLSMALPWKTSQTLNVDNAADDDEKGWQHVYDEIITPKRPEPKPVSKGFLPMDDGYQADTGNHSDEGYGSGGTPNIPEKPGRLLFPTGERDGADPYDPVRRTGQRKSLFGLRKKSSNAVIGSSSSFKPHWPSRNRSPSAVHENSEPPPLYTTEPENDTPSAVPGVQKRSKFGFGKLKKLVK